MRNDDGFNYVGAITERWNQKLKSVRITGMIVGIVMIVCSLLFMFFPKQAIAAVEIIIAVVIISVGIYQLVDYFSMPVFLRQTFFLVGGILNLFIGALLLASPKQDMNAFFACLFGIVLLIFGIDKVALGRKLNFFAVTGYRWLVVSGVLDIIASAVFLMVPVVAMVALNYFVAAYLLAGGIALLFEVLSMKEMQVR